MHDRAAMIRDKGPYALFAVLAVLFVMPAVIAPPMTHDSFWIDMSWSRQFTALLRTGNLYPRWLPWSYGGLGSPAFYYYAPLSFHLAGLFGLLGLSTYPALLAAFGAAWFASGATMYAWLKGRTRAPLIGALLYMVLPYHVMDFYARGALAEFCAFAVAPLVASGLREAVERGRVARLGLAYAALIMTHLPTAVIVSVLLIAPYALWSARTDARSLIAVARGVALGLAGAAIYLAPALTLQSHSSVGALWDAKFLNPTNWSLLHPHSWVSKSYVLLFAGLSGGIAVASALISVRQWSFWSAWTIAICLIVAGLFPGFWSLPVIKAVQFPWRALLLAEFGLATLAACWRGSPVILTAASLPLLVFSLVMATPANPMHGEPMRPLPTGDVQDVIEYLPPGAVGPDRTPRNDLLVQAAAAARAHPGSSFPYPSLQAICGSGVAPLVRNPGSPLILSAPEGCRLAVGRLPVEWIGLAVSLLAWAAMAAPMLVRSRNRLDCVGAARRGAAASAA
jgi:hypothetical protein